MGRWWWSGGALSQQTLFRFVPGLELVTLAGLIKASFGEPCPITHRTDQIVSSR